MHDGMQYDPIQGRAVQIWKYGYFQKLSLPFTMAAGNWPQILKLGHNIKCDQAGFLLLFFLVFVSCDVEVGRNVSCQESTISPVQC